VFAILCLGVACPAGEDVAVIHYRTSDHGPGLEWANFLWQAGYSVWLLEANAPGPLDAYDVIVDLSYEWSDPAHQLAAAMCAGRGVLVFGGAPLYLGINADPVVKSYLGANAYANGGYDLASVTADQLVGDCAPGTVLFHCNGPACGALSGATTANVLARWSGGAGTIGMLNNTWCSGRSAFVGWGGAEYPNDPAVQAVVLNLVAWLAGSPAAPNIPQNGDFGGGLYAWNALDLSEPAGSCPPPSGSCAVVGGAAEITTWYAYGRGALNQDYRRLAVDALQFDFAYVEGACSSARASLWAEDQEVFQLAATCDSLVPSNSKLYVRMLGSEHLLVANQCVTSGHVTLACDYVADVVHVYVESSPGPWELALPIPPAFRLFADRLRLYADNACCDGRNRTIVRFDNIWLNGEVVGDVNCDGAVDFEDINPFVLALSGPDAYADDYCFCHHENADCNGDGAVNFDDINAFVALLSQ
jgi:hypothetical protein